LALREASVIGWPSRLRRPLADQGLEAGAGEVGEQRGQHLVQPLAGQGLGQVGRQDLAA
jgi:hypothetical protein